MATFSPSSAFAAQLTDSSSRRQSSRARCAACDVKLGAKLLKCLHSLCVDCLPSSVSRENEVHCPRCSEVTSCGKGRFAGLATSALQWLPNCPGSSGADADAAASSGVGPRYCFECVEQEEAAEKCLDCQRVLCPTHAASHPRSRATYKHKLEPLAGRVPRSRSSRPMLRQHMCPVHPGVHLTSYCWPCEQLLCRLCVSTSAKHKEHQAGVESIQDTAARKRQALRRLVGEAESSGIGDQLTSSLDALATTLSDLDDQTEDVSAEVTCSFNLIVDAVRAREKHLLDGLDQLRSVERQPLQERRHRLQAMADGYGQVQSLLTEEVEDDDTNFLSMAGWLEEVLSRTTRQLSELGAGAAVARRPVFHAAEFEGALETIGSTGAVSMSQSTHGSATVAVAKDVDTHTSVSQDTFRDGCSSFSYRSSGHGWIVSRCSRVFCGRFRLRIHLDLITNNALLVAVTDAATPVLPDSPDQLVYLASECSTWWKDLDCQPGDIVSMEFHYLEGDGQEHYYGTAELVNERNDGMWSGPSIHGMKAAVVHFGLFYSNDSITLLGPPDQLLQADE